MAGCAARDLDDDYDDEVVFYPDTEKMPESTLQQLMIELLRPLLARFLAEQGRRDFVGADQFIYYIRGNPKACVAPDVYVLPGIDPESAPPCFKTWEIPSPPSFALEIKAEKNDLKDVVHAPMRHDEAGTKELVVFDPFIRSTSARMRFRVYRRDAQGKLGMVLATNNDRIESAELGCFLRAVGEGAAMRLRLATGPAGEELVPTDAERARAEGERARAEAERARAEAQRARAEAERAQAEAQRAHLAEQAKTEAEAEVARLRAELEALRRR